MFLLPTAPRADLGLWRRSPLDLLRDDILPRCIAALDGLFFLLLPARLPEEEVEEARLASLMTWSERPRRIVQHVSCTSYYFRCALWNITTLCENTKTCTDQISVTYKLDDFVHAYSLEHIKMKSTIQSTTNTHLFFCVSFFFSPPPQSSPCVGRHKNNCYFNYLTLSILL